MLKTYYPCFCFECFYIWTVEDVKAVSCCPHCKKTSIFKAVSTSTKTCQTCQTYRECLQDGMQHCFKWYKKHMNNYAVFNTHEIQTMFFKVFAENCKDYMKDYKR